MAHLIGRYHLVLGLEQALWELSNLVRGLSLNVDWTVKVRCPEDSDPTKGSDGSDLVLRIARLQAALRHPNLPRMTDYFLIVREA
jgi:hypothetical protein